MRILGQREIEQTEIRLLLLGIYESSGHDFRDYAPAALRLRIRRQVTQEGLISVSGLQEKALHDSDAMERLLSALYGRDTTMFPDPEFYLAFRHSVVPRLRTYPYVRIWYAGCGTGPEVYGLAILLQEEGLLDRCRLYATEANPKVLAQAAAGCYAATAMEEYGTQYLRAGGLRALSDYYHEEAGRAQFDVPAANTIVWGEHNLVTDASFNSFHVILCRNVMIYFGLALRNRVQRLLYESLELYGVLGLGSGESLRQTQHEYCYRTISNSGRLYRKVR